jgi:RHS repeat-associated protein
VKHPSTPTIAACAGSLLGALLATNHVVAQTLPPPPVSPAPVTALEYDAEGNPKRQTQAPGAPGFATTHQYDRLNRRSQTTDARGGTVSLNYDGREGLVQVTDPRGLVTRYPRNGLGDALGLVSPDTGSASHTVDAAGNLLTRTDSRGVLATHTYDALNRLRSITYSGAGLTSQVFGWTYDQTGPAFGYGVGRLTSTSYPSGSSTYRYDALGRVLTSSQTVYGAESSVTLATTYGYDAAGRITSITYPSGRVLRLARAGGQIVSISLAASATATPQTLLSAIQSDPAPGSEGAVRSWLWHLNGRTQPHDRVFDTYGRMVRHPLGGAVRDLLYDAADRITGYRHLDAATGSATPAAQALDQSFGYDELGRLTSVGTSVGQWTLAYDANGNRTSLSLTAGGATQTRQYQVAAASNRLLGLDNPTRAIAHDPAGNTTADQSEAGAWAAAYDASNRLASLTRNGAQGQPQGVVFGYNAQSQRIYKATSANAGPALRRTFVYDLEGGLLGEYDAVSGAVLREYVWLQGMPVAFADGPPAAQLVYYVYTDHLDTPRVVIDQAGNQRWSWIAEPFGNSAPVTSPTGLAAVELNLRFPGQYFDAETGLSYNHHRDYDASIGRYTQSDPIGLQGGINTYAYVGSNPLSYTDPEGLQSIAQCANPANAAVCAEAGIIARGAGAGAGAILSVPGDTSGQRIDDIINGFPVPRWPGLSSLGECTKGKMIVEPARDKRWRAGGISIEQEYICNCGQITRHTVIFKGAVVHDHFRPGAPKAGGGD